MVASDPALCQRLEGVVRRPSALPLPDFEQQLNLYFGNYCHRDAASGWVRDKYVRDAGPFTATFANGAWQGVGHGTHAPVVIWYSPEMVEWLRKYRPADGSGPADAAGRSGRRDHGQGDVSRRRPPPAATSTR